MKTLLKIVAFVFATVLLCASPVKADAQVGVSFQVFYDGLSPYGSWIDDPSYGYVWVPDAGAGFVPYESAGHWVYTDYGWTWYSDYAWGWAPFHYGRWVYDDFYGWMWIPGDEWAPAWVSWRECDGFYGWAPLGPGFTVGLFFGYEPIPDNDWVFVSTRYFTGPRVYMHYQPRSYNARYIQQSSRINTIGGHGHDSYYSGPARGNVERATGHTVGIYTINNRTKPGESVARNSLSLYRPAVNAKTAAGGNRPAPRKFSAYRAKAGGSHNAVNANYNRKNNNSDRGRAGLRNSSPGAQNYASPRHGSPQRNSQRSIPEQHHNYIRPQPRPSYPARQPMQREPYHPQPRPTPHYNINRPQPVPHQQFNAMPHHGGGRRMR